MSTKRLPLVVDKNIISTYVNIEPQDQFIYTFETTQKLTLTGSVSNSGQLVSVSAPLSSIYEDYVVTGSQSAGYGNVFSTCSLTSAVTGSNSAVWRTTQMLLYHRGYEPYSNLTATPSSLTARYGIFALRKRYHDTEIKKGTITATVHNQLSGQSLDGDYYDNASGSLKKVSDGSTVGTVLYDLGLIVVSGNSNIELVRSITSFKYQPVVQNVGMNVFCKCPANKLNYTFNHTSYKHSILDDNISVNRYDDLYHHSTITASTTGAQYRDDLVASGLDFSPYITSVGLYDDNLNLLAVAKLTRPLRKPFGLPITFNFQIDL